MSFSDIFIRRPVLSTVLACMILLLGFQAIFNLSIRQYPKVDETAITITTAYPGASADLIQGFISAPIARAVASTENIDYVTSSSRPSSSTVTVQMKLGSNPDVALTEVLSKVQGVRGTTQNEYVVSSITVHSTLQTPEAFSQLPIRSTDGQVVRLRDVAHVELGAVSTDTRVSFNGKPGTFLAIFPTPAANPLTTAE